MPRPGHIYLNGRIMPASEAAISPFDIGLHRGYAVFDLLQTAGGKPFQLTEHLTRFRASAAQLDLRVPLSDQEMTDVILELIELNGFAESVVKFILTGGESADGMHFDPEAPTFLITVQELFEVPEHFYRDGAALLAVEHRREVPEAKTTNYITWLRNHHRIEQEGAIDVLYHADGYVSEAATASFYVIRDGRIHAPAEGVLRGTVGTMVLERAAAEFEIVRGPISLEEAFDADEAYITSSVRGVVPIVSIDEHRIGDGTVGPVVSRLMEICRAVMQSV